MNHRRSAVGGQLANLVHFTFSTVGTFHVPSMMDGGVAFGQYIRSIGTNAPGGAGSQLASLSWPGDWCWKYNVNEPSSEYFKLFRGLTVNLFSSFGTNHQPLSAICFASSTETLLVDWAWTDYPTDIGKTMLTNVGVNCLSTIHQLIGLADGVSKDTSVIA